jgi:hypothetical protein
MSRRFLLVITLLAACSPKSEDPAQVSPTLKDSAAADAPAETGAEDVGFIADAAPMDAPPEVVAKVYANTDNTLWQMDPLTKSVTKVGPFKGLAAGEDMTDIAVDATGKVYGVSVVPSEQGHIYQITLPASA